MQADRCCSHALSDRLLAAARGHRQALHTLALLLVELVDGRHHRALGYATLSEYAAKVLDLPARQARDLLRIGRALPRLPKLGAAMEAGALDWTKARELVRVATPETEEAWVARAAVRSSRVLEREVASAQRGDLPAEQSEPERGPVRTRVSFELEAADRAVLFDALALFRARAGVNLAEVEDGEVLAAMAWFVIGHAEVETPGGTPTFNAHDHAEDSPVHTRGDEEFEAVHAADGLGVDVPGDTSFEAGTAADGLRVEGPADASFEAEIGADGLRVEGPADASFEAEIGADGLRVDVPRDAGLDVQSARMPNAATGLSPRESAGASVSSVSSVSSPATSHFAQRRLPLSADARSAPAEAGPAAGVRASARSNGAPTGERYRIILEHCPCCATTTSREHDGRVADVSDTIAAEATCDAEIVDMRPGARQGHATRAVSPALRRKVLHRAGWRCEVPGCANHLWLDVHHVWAWARGGTHAERNLAVLCSTHHRATHRGTLAIERLPSGAVRVTHGDGRVYVGKVPATHVGRRGPLSTAA